MYSAGNIEISEFKDRISFMTIRLELKEEGQFVSRNFSGLSHLEDLPILGHYPTISEL